MSIPLVDLSLGEEAAFDQVKAAATATGFFYLVNHGVPKEVVEAHWDASRCFFELPLEEKMKARGGSRGYTPANEQTLDPGVYACVHTVCMLSLYSLSCSW
jgi:isopenicillin N synthase-like dioxygenase